jgi:uncharacterized membrane protein
MLAVKRARRRAALAALCVFAVALAATLFPAGGFGSQPAGVGAGGGPDAPTGGPAPANESPTATPATNSDTATTDQEPATTAEPTTTEATETTTVGAASDPGTGDGGPGAGALFGALFALAGVVTAVGLWTGAIAVTATTAGAIPFTVTVGDTPIGSLVGAIPARTMALVVGLSASVPRILDDAAALSREVATGLSTAVGGVARATESALRVGAAGLGATVAAVPRALAGLGAGASLLSRVGGAGLPSLGLGGRDRSSRAGGTTASSDPDGDAGLPSIEEAWQAMAERVRIRNRDARTPGEFARAAVERGYPDDAVARLTDAFREVRYGDLSRADRTSAARSALDRIRRHREGDDE